MKSLPKNVRVGFRTYTIREIVDPGLSDKMGLHHGSENRIAVSLRYSHAENANTLIHEVMHGIWDVYRLDELEGSDKEEALVSAIGNALTQVWRDNPALVRWIDETLTAANDNEGRTDSASHEIAVVV